MYDRPWSVADRAREAGGDRLGPGPADVAYTRPSPSNAIPHESGPSDDVPRRVLPGAGQARAEHPPSRRPAGRERRALQVHRGPGARRPDRGRHRHGPRLQEHQDQHLLGPPQRRPAVRPARPQGRRVFADPPGPVDPPPGRPRRDPPALPPGPARAAALRRPRRQFAEKKLPEATILGNVLYHNYQIIASAKQSAAEAFLESARFAGALGDDNVFRPKGPPGRPPGADLAANGHAGDRRPGRSAPAPASPSPTGTSGRRPDRPPPLGGRRRQGHQRPGPRGHHARELRTPHPGPPAPPPDRGARAGDPRSEVDPRIADPGRPIVGPRRLEPAIEICDRFR